jgi:hypothetical protein
MKGLTVAWLIVIALALGMNPAREDIRTGATPIGHSSDAQYYAYLPNTVKTEATTFAVIGDYGSANNNEAQVAALVKNWSPAFIVTVGDNNYPSGSAATIDAAIGQYYAGYIYPYSGTYTYTATAIANRFFPALGNHDWLSSYAAPYLSYFTLPGNERYYDIVRGPVHLFILDSDANEPDGITANSPQGAWLQTHLADSTACWKLVFLHHAPYSSALHGSTTTSQWPYQVPCIPSAHPFPAAWCATTPCTAPCASRQRDRPSCSSSSTSMATSSTPTVSTAVAGDDKRET